ncbi:MAG: hypothetical protein IJT66_02350 [Clostridia bacterium]|nr:hypothetical protein [Clostridia bacterium]
MNNIKYYNDSLAYDFEMFAPKPAKTPGRQDNIVTLPARQAQNRRRTRTATKAMSPSVLAIMAAVFVLAGLCGNIALRLEINEVNSQISKMRSSINELQSEKTGLEVEAQRRIAYANLELEAMELGMKKLEKDSVTYIRVNQQDTAKTADGKLLAAEE